MSEYEKAAVLLESMENKRDMGDNMEKRAEVIIDAPDRSVASIITFPRSID